MTVAALVVSILSIAVSATIAYSQFRLSRRVAREGRFATIDVTQDGWNLTNGDTVKVLAFDLHNVGRAAARSLEAVLLTEEETTLGDPTPLGKPLRPGDSEQIVCRFEFLMRPDPAWLVLSWIDDEGKRDARFPVSPLPGEPNPELARSWRPL